MRRWGLTFFLLMFFASIATSLGAPADAVTKRRVAIMNFDFGTVQRWWSGDWDVGKGISDMLVTKLVKDGTYSVVERKMLDQILAEQNFSNSDRANPMTAAKIGKILGVNAIIVGSITQFGFDDKNFKVGGGGGSWGGFGLGGIGKKSMKAMVAIDARMVDTTTAEILGVAQGKGESKRGGFSVGGAGGGGGGWGAGGLDMGSSNFQESILGEATRAAVDQVAGEIISNAEKIVATKIEINGIVADVDGQNAILNVGKDQGVKMGDTYKLERVTRTVKDPATGKVLKQVTSLIGTIKIIEVDASSATGVVTGGPAKVGDVVKSVTSN
ncbi:MAG: curli production assembly protein CsgG [Acidobacteriia bacterium]|nr:curli production assembly protein CsgG [Terriglobia bacterium]